MCPRSTASHDDDWSQVSGQFNMPVIISTFAAAVIVAFLSLVNDIVSKANSRPIIFYIGALFSFLAMSLHLAIIIIASRSASLASLYALDPGPHRKCPARERLRFYLALCDQLQLLATLIFVVAVSIHAFIVFEHYVWPVAILGWCCILFVGLFLTGYSEDSILIEDAKWLKKYCFDRKRQEKGVQTYAGSVATAASSSVSTAYNGTPSLTGGQPFDHDAPRAGNDIEAQMEERSMDVNSSETHVG